MKTFLRSILGAAMLVGAAGAQGGNTIYSWTGYQPIPDNNASGVAFTFFVGAPTPEVITSVSVSMNIAGGWNGDLFAYLSHGSGYSVLLNRVEKTAEHSTGSNTSGMDVTFSDSHVTDIHTFGGAVLSGDFSPDGRNANPFGVLNTDSRDAMLDSFVGLNAGGFWTLFIADLSPLAVSTIQSWSVNISTAPVPEPGSASIALLMVLCGFLVRKNGVDPDCGHSGPPF